MYGDGKQTRCFAHVLDVVEALPKLVQLPAARGQIYNIGSTEEVSMLELAQRVKAATGGRSEIELIPYEKAYVEGFEDMRRRVPDLAKIQKAIGYRPKRGLDQILQRCHRRPASQIVNGGNERLRRSLRNLVRD